MVFVSRPLERPVVFGRGQHLVGVECRPAPEDAVPDAPVALFINAGIIHRVGPHRIYVKTARAMAAGGIPSLRFDLSGIGGSRTVADGSGPRARETAVRSDIDDALDHIHRRLGDARVVTVGLCSGADRAFESAVRQSVITGAVLMDPDVHITLGHRAREIRSALGRKRTLTSLLKPGHLRSALRTLSGPDRSREAGESSRSALAVTRLPDRETREQEILRLLDRDVALHYVFTAGLLERYNHRDQFFEAYPAARSHARMRLTWFPGADHTFSAEAAQEELVNVIRNWFAETFLAAHRP